MSEGAASFYTDMEELAEGYSFASLPDLTEHVKDRPISAGRVYSITLAGYDLQAIDEAHDRLNQFRRFWKEMEEVVDNHMEKYLERNFTSLQI